MQLALFPQRVRVKMRRRLAYSAALIRWRWETLLGTVERRWRDIAIVRFDGRPRDGSARGCTLQVPIADMVVLPSTWASPAEILQGAMRGRAPRFTLQPLPWRTS